MVRRVKKERQELMVHHSGEDDLAGAKTFYGLDPTKSFHIDDDVKQVYLESAAKGEEHVMRG